MANFFAVRMPPGPGGDEFVGLLNQLDSRYRVSTDTEKLTNFMRSEPDSPEIRSTQGILASEKAGGVQRLAAGRDSSFRLKSTGNEPFGTRGTSSLLQNNFVVGASVMNPNFSLLFQEPRALNAVDILLGTSEDSSLDSVVKKEEPEEECPLFTLNPRKQQGNYPLFKDADALVKKEVDEDFGQDSGVIECLIKEEEIDDDFGDSGDHEEELGEGLREDTNQGAPDDLSVAFVDKGNFYHCKLCDEHLPKCFLWKHWLSHPRCGYCGRRFITEEALSIHKRVHTGCDVCGKAFSNASYLKIHMRIHTGEKPFQCEHCEKAFATKWHLNLHSHIHTGEKPFKCELCQMRFNQKNSLTVHWRCHTGEKPFRCERCQKSFATSSKLKEHTRLHTGEKPFRCEHCEKSFATKGNLKSHTLVHTGDKPFECEECQKRFNWKNDLTVHLRTHTGEKPYLCPECPKKFTTPTNLKRHRSRAHGLQKTSA